MSQCDAEQTEEPIWKRLILEQFKARNRQEIHPFKHIMSQHAQVLGECFDYKNMLNGLQNEVKMWKSRYEEASKKMKNFDELRQDTFATTQHVKELELKILGLQDELVCSFRSKSETARSLLDINRDLLKARTNLREKKAELAATKVEFRQKVEE
ncbi:tipD, partial [Acrasis kona]